MIKDRLKELKSFQRPSHNDLEDWVVVFRDDNAQDIHLFLHEVEAIHDMLANIRVNTNEIRALFNIILSMPGAHEKKNSEVTERQSVVNNTIRNVRSKLQNLEAMVNSIRNPSEMLHRIHIVQLYSLHQIFKTLIEEYNTILINHKERCSAIMKRQIAISNHEGELEDLLDKDVSVFVDNIIADTLEAQLMLNLVSSRHAEIKRIESSLQEMRDMFIELAIHVENQGEKMNCIRYLIEKSELYAIQSAAKLEKARINAKRKRRRCRKIKLAVAIIAIIFGFVLLVLITT